MEDGGADETGSAGEDEMHYAGVAVGGGQRERERRSGVVVAVA